MTRGSSPLVMIAVWLIHNLWQGRLSRWYSRKFGILCRFYPSCSQYASEALVRYGFVRGWLLAWHRVRRCHPDNCDTCYDLP